MLVLGRRVGEREELLPYCERLHPSHNGRAV